MAELPHIGKHCSVAGCNILEEVEELPEIEVAGIVFSRKCLSHDSSGFRRDFLPFTCNGCLKVFCSSHRTKDLHSCTKENIPENTLEYKGPTGFTCSLPSCSNRELTEIICGHCQQSFCLSHRHAQDHSCPKWEDPVKESQISKTAEHVNNIIASKPSTSKTPKKLRGGAKSSKTAAKLALIKMKMHAQGDKGCPQEERVYTCVCLPVRCKRDAVPMFFSKTWSIGRVVDSIADRLGLKNDNNIQNAQKLRMFSTTNGAMFQTDTQLETLIKEETIYNGSSVILEYVGNGCVELEDMTCYKIT